MSLGEQPSPVTKEPAHREIVTSAQLSERARELLREPFEGKPLKGVVGFHAPDGSIVLNEMWYDLREDGTILMNTAKFRRKYRYLQQDNNRSISLIVSRGNYQYVTMNGTVELNDDPETAQRDIRHLAKRYHGADEAERMMAEEFSQTCNRPRQFLQSCCCETIHSENRNRKCTRDKAFYNFNPMGACNSTRASI